MELSNRELIDIIDNRYNNLMGHLRRIINMPSSGIMWRVEGGSDGYFAIERFKEAMGEIFCKIEMVQKEGKE